MMVRRLAWLMTIAMLAPGLAHGEPSAIVRNLIGQQVSEFSFGLYRMGVSIDEFAGRHGGVGLVDYDWDRNEINISIVDLRNTVDNKTACSERISDVRLWAFVGQDAGRIAQWLAGLIEGRPTIKTSRFARLFGPIGYSRSTLPENTDAHIDSIITINAYIGAAKEQVRCHGRLLSDRVSFEEQSGAPVADARTVRLTRDQLREVQSALSALGLYSGARDGLVGPATTAAVRRFQAQNAMPVTGDIDLPTLTAIMSGGQQARGRRLTDEEAFSPVAPPPRRTD